MNKIRETLRKQIAADALCSCGEGISWDVLQNQDTLTLGFLGGSVTQGYAQNRLYDKAYPAFAAEMLRKELHRDVRIAVCAEAGMDAMTGNVLAERVILSQKPDIVFLEFAINETTLPPSVLSFESLLRKLLSAPHPPIVCLLLMRSANDYSCESFMRPIAEHYRLPCISLRQGIRTPLDAGLLRWEDFADAESHPNPEGHLLLAECVSHLLRTALHTPQTPKHPLPQPWLGAPFLSMKLCCPGQLDCPDAFAALETVPTGELYFPQAWRLSAETPLSFTLRCQVLVLFYEQHHLPQYGSCRVLRDGIPMREPLRSNSIYGWGNACHAVIFQSEADEAESAEHRITLEVQNGDFYILAAAYH